MDAKKTKIKVRGYHLDLYGHVNNARYLELLEEARWDYYEQRMDFAEFGKRGWAFVVVNININYRSPAVLGDTIEIETRIKDAGKRSVVLKQIVGKSGSDTVVADAEVTFVILDARTGKALPIEGNLRETLLGIHQD